MDEKGRTDEYMSKPLQERLKIKEGWQRFRRPTCTKCGKPAPPPGQKCKRRFERRSELSGGCQKNGKDESIYSAPCGQACGCGSVVNS